MNIDIVVPKNNEQEFLLMAEKLGYTAIIFFYKNKPEIKKITHEKVQVFIACSEKTNDVDLVIHEHDQRDREIIERQQAQLISKLESEQRKDFIRQRASGLNHVITTLMHQKNVSVCFSLNEIIYAQYRSQLLGRMMQNVKLCRKDKVKMILASLAPIPYAMRSPHDLKALAIVLGMHPEEAKAALKNACEICKKNNSK
ncbi:hypothetical protein J4457_06605 [Candidatus Woesearchaeota archaeon]|nr:hypothetical protein [Candidatus Woesearchaeota archaeon]